MSSFSQRKALKEFKQITSTTDKTARKALQSQGWNLEQALDYFFSNRHEFPAEKKGNATKLNKIFDKYATDPEAKDDLCDAELFKFLQDVQIDPNKAESFGLCWKLNCEDMGVISRDEFVQGFSILGVDTMAAIKQQAQQVKKAMQDPAHFKAFYQWLFKYCTEGERKTLDKDMALNMWGLVMPDHWPLAEDWCTFVREHSVRAISLDVWTQVLAFSREIKPDLSNWQDDGAWPVIIDEFVEMKQEQAS